ncbi:MAG: SGNH/GDSL hydrolase family protein, partial [Lachnospiraceae bacterium]|nr:SGNH/GDSL hydrolase family protein [Lachnospiraceae bacterium]
SPEAATEQATEGALIFEEPESEGAMRHTRVTDLSRRAIFVGDSRTVGLWHAIDDYGDECIYIGESGEGYDWFIETGLDRMEDAISDNPGVPVIFNLGVNDCENISNYIAVYQDLIAAQPDTHFYIMSVNPVTEDSVNVPNSDVIQFNEVMQDVFADRYIDTYRQMLEYGFVSPDGIHYSQATYRDIHNYALLQLAEYEMKASSHN